MMQYIYKCRVQVLSTSSGPRVAAAVESTPSTPPSGSVHSFTQRSSDPVARMLSWNGEKSKSVTLPREGVRG